MRDALVDIYDDKTMIAVTDIGASHFPVDLLPEMYVRLGKEVKKLLKKEPSVKPSGSSSLKRRRSGE